jgi:hypothetical protein
MSAAVAEPLEYVESPGPGISELPELTEGDLAAAREHIGEPQVPEYPGWQLEHVETFLLGLGQGIHMLIGVAEHDWEMTRTDLQRIAPPMCRIANRWEPALRASVYADPIMVAYGFAVYGWRSALERARALKDREVLEQPQPARYERASAQEEPENAGEPAGGDFQAVSPMFPQAARPRYRQ